MSDEILNPVTDESLSAALSVSTDQSDYAPGSTATITATGADVGGAVTFEVDQTIDNVVVVGSTISGTGVSWSVVDGGAGDLDGLANGTVVTTWAVGQDALNQAFVASAINAATGAVATTVFTDSSHGTIIDLTAANSSTTLNNGAVFQWVDPTNAGTGQYNPFLSTSSNDGDAEGYNRDSATDYLDVNHQRTTSLLFSSLPVKVINGITYYEFRVDLNEFQILIALNQLKLYKSVNAATAADFNNTTDEFGAGFTKVVDLDASGNFALKLDAHGSGSGTDDYALYVPVTDFGNVLATPYFTMYVDWGGTPNNGQNADPLTEDGGFEEWKTQTAATVTGIKFLDSNSNGQMDAGEVPLQGWTIFVDSDHDGVLDPTEQSVVTNNDGTFALSGIPLDSGTVWIDEVLLDGWAQTTGDHEEVTVNGAGLYTGVQIGNHPGDTTLNVHKSADVLSVDSAGDIIHYTITVQNAGGIGQTGVTVNDPLLGGNLYLAGDTDTDGVHDAGENWSPNGDTNNDGILQVGETWTYTGSYTVKQVDLDVNGIDGHGNPDFDGDIDNTVTVNSAEAAAQLASATVAIAGSPDLTITKDADLSTVDAAGQTIQYTIQVANSGNVMLTGVTMSDPNLGGTLYLSGDTDHDGVHDAGENWAPNGDTDNDGNLDVGETWTYTGSHTVTQAEMNAGTNILNTATVDTVETNPKSDDATTTITQNPSLTIDKVADKASVSAAGTAISYTITVNNTGNIDLTGVTLDDTSFGDSGATLFSGDTNTNGILETNETWVYHASHTVTQAEMNAGAALVNVATVDTAQTNPQSDDATTTITQNPSLTIDKIADKASVSAAGAVISYTITVDNTGNVDLTGVTLDDTSFGDSGATLFSGDTNTNGILEINETWVYHASHTVTQAEMDAGAALTNVAVVDTTQTSPQSDDATTTITQNKALSIVKTGSVADGHADSTSDVVAWAIDVGNAGNAAVAGVTVSDTLADAGATFVNGDTDGDGKLDVGETWHYTASHAVTQADLDAGGNITNVATAHGTGVTNVSDGDSVPVEQHKALSIVKTGSVADGHANSTSDVVAWAIDVGNAGNAAVAGVTVSDTLADAGATFVNGDTDGDGKLDVGETWHYTASHAVTQADLDAGGNITNVATASGTGVTNVSDGDSVPVEQHKALSIVKTGSVADGHADSTSDVVAWAIDVGNAGNAAVAGVTVSDTLADAGAAFVNGDTDGDGKLDVGETWHYTASHAVTHADLDAGGNITNVATAHGTGATNVSDDASVPVEQHKALSIVKTGSVPGGTADAVGEVITWTIDVSNAGNAAVGGVTVTDPNAPNVAPVLSGGFNSGDADHDNLLDWNETWHYTASHTMTLAEMLAGGNITNVAVAHGTNVSDVSDDATIVIEQKPSIDVQKYVSVDGKALNDPTKIWIDADDPSGPTLISTAGIDPAFKITVENTGFVTLHNVTVDDTKGTAATGDDLHLNSITTPALATLAVGSGPITVATYTLPWKPGQQLNIATADSDESNADTDPAYYFGAQPGFVTNSSLTTFDTNASLAGKQFNLLFTPDFGLGNGNYKLSDSNPGQFYYNTFFNGTPGETHSFTMEIPKLFVPQGAVPVHAYDSVHIDTVGGQIQLTPGTEIANFKMPFTTTDWDHDGNLEYTFNVTFDQTGFVYLNMHLDYSLEKQTGWVKSSPSSGTDNAVDNPNLAGVQPEIKDNTAYIFLAGEDLGAAAPANNAPSIDTIYNDNQFKTLKGIGGIFQAELTGTIDHDHLAMAGQKLVIKTAAGALIGTATTDADGWYYFAFNATSGKTNYNVFWDQDGDGNVGISDKLNFSLANTEADSANHALSSTVALGGNAGKFAEVDFTVYDPTLVGAVVQNIHPVFDHFLLS